MSLLFRSFGLILGLWVTGVAASPLPELTIYTYDSLLTPWGAGAPLAKAFEGSCGCKITWVGVDDGVTLLNRLRLEGKRSKADVVLGLDDSLVGAALETGLFAPHDLAVLPPFAWSHSVFVPYDFSYYAFIYNAKTLPNPPASFAELLQRPELKIIYQDPRTSTPGQGLLLWVKAIYGDKAPAVWQKLAAQTVTVTKGWTESYGLFLKQEADLVLSYLSSPAYHILEDNETHYKAALFKEGHYRQVEVAARLQHSQHPKLAQDFLQFLSSPAAQRIFPTHNWMYSLDPQWTPAAFPQLPGNTLSLPDDLLHQQRNAWLVEWRKAAS